jgi:hypothetical protein
MTPLVAVGSLLFMLVVYACIGFWRYHAIDVVALADYKLVPEAPNSGGDLIVIALVVVWGGLILALGHFGHADLQGLVWAGTAIAVLAFVTVKSFLPARCKDCAGPVRFFRKRQSASVPAIVHLRLCDQCKTYREEPVIGLADG